MLGTGVATRRIPDGARVRVDGDAGTVTLLDGQAETAADRSSGRRPGLLAVAAGGAALGAVAWVRRVHGPRAR